ncbi:hypothetical protein [Natronoglycomyces albus]|uniref:Excreted virulence factor EspC, type VII ESX diderm n=1 Tax=Natronoglycomyces albus TaxID=2811108 RepID=A0A895XTE5_9ACTN|nr:hypothetical protein [Natronoglycomyces albus]QSB05530.1 hypothetical protein JQS30_00885 [Natronoglycomyces albus]
MSSGINLDPAALENAATAIRGTASEVKNVADYAREADPDVWIWGIPGTLLAAPYYFMFSEMLHESIAGAQETVEGFAEMLDECRRNQVEADEDMAKVFLDLDGELEGKFKE